MQHAVRIRSASGFQTSEAQMTHTALKWFAVACLTAISQGLAAAPLDGRTIETANFHGTAPDVTVITGPESRVVGPGIELTTFGWLGFLNINFSDTNILITAATDQPFGFFEAIRFSDVIDNIPAFTNVSLNPSTNWAGFDSSRIIFESDLIQVSLTGLNGLQGQQISLDLTATPGQVPEPATIWLLVVGMTTLFAWRRRQISQALIRA
jgi:hypothetical protein